MSILSIFYRIWATLSKSLYSSDFELNISFIDQVMGTCPRDWSHNYDGTTNSRFNPLAIVPEPLFPICYAFLPFPFILVTSAFLSSVFSFFYFFPNFTFKLVFLSIFILSFLHFLFIKVIFPLLSSFRSSSFPHFLLYHEFFSFFTFFFLTLLFFSFLFFSISFHSNFSFSSLYWPAILFFLQFLKYIDEFIFLCFLPFVCSFFSVFFFLFL